MLSGENKKFINLILTIVLPVAFQGIIATTLNMADTVMVATLGDAAIAAVGLVNQYMYFFMVTVFGICSGSSIFITQFYGKKDIDNINRHFVIMMLSVFGVGVIFTIASIIFNNQLLQLFSHESEVRELAGTYLNIIIFTFIITGLSFGVTTALRSSGDAKSPVIISVISFFANIIFNYIFIFGKLGFPRMGVAGAALGTLIARIIEIVLSMIIIKRPDVVFKFSYKIARSIDRKCISSYLKIATPVILAETLWSLAQLFFSAIYARTGKQGAAAIQVTNTIQNVFFILSNSLCAAAAIIIGQMIGAKEYKRTKEYASKFMKLTILIGVISGLVLMIFPKQLLLLYFGLDKGLKNVSINLLIIRGVFILFRFINAMFVIGIFRGGGDSKVPLIYELITIWIYALPVALIGTFLLKLSIEMIFVLVSIEEIIKIVMLIPRYISGKWLKNVTE